MYPAGHLPQRKPPFTTGSHWTPGKHGWSAQVTVCLLAVVPLCTLLPGVVKPDAATSCNTAKASGAGSASSPSAENSDSESE